MLLRPDGLGPVDFGTPAEKAIEALTVVLGPPDGATAIVSGGECVEGSGWLDCLRALRLIEHGRLVAWDGAGLQVAFVDSEGSAPQQRRTPLQLGDWRATPATGGTRLTTAEGLYPGMSVGELRRVAPDVEFAYNEGILDAFAVAAPRGGGYDGRLDWSSATADNQFSDLVRAVQAALNAHGADLVVDGEWGPRSQAAWEDVLHDRSIEPPPQLWLTEEIGKALGLPPDEFGVATIGPRPSTTPAPSLPLRPGGFGRYNFGDPAEELVSTLEDAFGPPSDEVVFSVRPPDELHLPGGYPARYDLVQYRWSAPSFLIILSDMPFRGDHWDEAVPGTLHLVSWESTSGRLQLDTDVTIGSTLTQLRAAYPDVTIGTDSFGCQYQPAAFVAGPDVSQLRGMLDWDWVTELQAALNDRGATLEVDGRYGPATRAAVERFQRAHGLDDEDGGIGPETLQALALNAPATTRITALEAGYPGSC